MRPQQNAAEDHKEMEAIRSGNKASMRPQQNAAEDLVSRKDYIAYDFKLQ